LPPIDPDIFLIILHHIPKETVLNVTATTHH